jgi:hypothetical protein
MPKASPILQAFNGGELSPFLDGRTDHKAVAPTAHDSPESAVLQSNSQCVRGHADHGLHLAAAMAGLAVGLETARIISRRRNS